MLSRFRAHARRQDWFAVAIDLAIVIVGVFLGIQASNWNQERHERAEAKELRQQLISNLKANEADLEARSDYYGQVQRHAIAALEAIDQPGSKLDEQWLVDAYQASQVWLRPFERTAFDDLQASGLVRKIGDAQTRAAISGYAVSAAGFEPTGLGVTTYRDKIRRAMPLSVQNQIRSSCGDQMRALPSGGQAPTLPTSCHIAIAPSVIRSAVSRVEAIPELDQELTRLIVDIDQKQALFARMLRNARELRRRLEGS